MSNSTHSRFGRWDDEDFNRPHKKSRYSPTERERVVIDDDADSLRPIQKKRTINSNIPQSDWWVATGYLGSGSFGSVFLAISHVDNMLPKYIVVKSSEMSRASRLMKEKKLLTRLKSPFVVSCYGHELDDIYYDMLIEYCAGGCVAECIKNNQGGGGGLGEDNVKKIASDILAGLKYIHGEKIVHCDIQPKNILLVPDDGDNNRFRAKISGFGKAIEKESIEDDGWCGHRRDTTRFMSPELVGEMVLDYGVDVWAFGCTVLEMLTGERAWGEHGELDWEEWISLIGESGLVPYVPESLSQEARDFLSKCLVRDPAQRWSVDCLLKHPFLRNHEYPQDVEEEEEDIGDEFVEAYLEEEEEGEVAYLEEEEDDIEVEWVQAYLDEEVVDGIEAEWVEEDPEEEEEQEEIEIDEEYPKEEDSEDDP